jgi:hypothetical protein
VLCIAAFTQLVLVWIRSGLIWPDFQHFTLWFNVTAANVLAFAIIRPLTVGKRALAFLHPLAGLIILVFWTAMILRTFEYMDTATTKIQFWVSTTSEQCGPNFSRWSTPMCVIDNMISIVHHFVVPLYLWIDVLLSSIRVHWCDVVYACLFLFLYTIQIVVFTIYSKAPIYKDMLDLHERQDWWKLLVLLLLFLWSALTSVRITRANDDKAKEH